MPEAFRKLLTSHATHRWQTEIQEGILLMCELYIDLLITRLQYDPVPCSMLSTLALILTLKMIGTIRTRIKHHVGDGRRTMEVFRTRWTMLRPQSLLIPIPVWVVV